MNAHTLTLPAFGTPIPNQGGLLAAIMRGATQPDGGEAPPYALLVSPQDAEGAEIPSVIWGEYGKEVPNADHRRDGQANTAAMALAGCPAALAIHGKEIAGHADWYLASLGEMNSAHANVPELFAKDGYYWTSTQSSRNFAYVQDFESGYSLWGAKVDEFRVRAFRRIQLQHLIA